MHPDRHQLVAARLPTGFSACFLLALISGCPSSSDSVRTPATTTSNRKTGSRPIEATIDLGVLYQGESAQTNRWIVNQSNKSMNIEKIQTSCECVNLTLESQEIDIGEKVLAHLSYDGTKEPDFTGSLQIRITLTDNKDQEVGTILVPVEVVSRK